MIGVTAGADEEPLWCCWTDGEGDGDVDIATSLRRCRPRFLDKSWSTALAGYVLDFVRLWESFGASLWHSAATAMVSAVVGLFLRSSCLRLMPR